VYALSTPKEETPTAAFRAAKRGRKADANRPFQPEFAGINIGMDLYLDYITEDEDYHAILYTLLAQTLAQRGQTGGRIRRLTGRQRIKASHTRRSRRKALRISNQAHRPA